MDRKATAKETLKIMERGSYEINGKTIDISKMHAASIDNSMLFTPMQAEEILAQYPETDSGIFSEINKLETNKTKTIVHVVNCSTVDVILKLNSDGILNPGVLNFASAKNPGGGFLNGAMAQEESLAASSGLYQTLIKNEDYYINNRKFPSMIYTDHAIYSPEVVFFRDGDFRLLEMPVTASVLTLPAVNMGQVILKGEDVQEAEKAMRRRMKLALALFAKMGIRHLVLGAYGCGVFRNDPYQVACWWKELLENSFAGSFDSVTHAVLDRSAKGDCIRAFEEVFGD